MRASAQEARILAAVKLSLIAVWSVVIFFVLASTVSDSPVRPPFRLRINTVALAPEGWAFFTRNPREAVVLVHKMRDTGRWERLSLANFTPGNLFGLRRSSRLLTTEMALLLRGIPSDRWVPCRASIPECLAREKPATFTVEKKTPAVASLCGETVLQVVEPVPWAWSSSRDRIRMPSKILKLKVRCS